jgi:flagellar hook-associated protein 2
MALSAPGIGSSLDVNSIVSQLMQLEQQPLVAMTRREGVFTAQLSTIGTIKGALSGFQTAATALSNAGASGTFKLSSSDSGALSGSVDTTATAGSHSVSVTQLAQSQRLVAAGQASASARIGNGSATTLSLSFGTIAGGSLDAGSGLYSGASFTADPARASVQVAIDGSNNTLEGIRDAINAANAGVTAAIVNDGSGSPYRLSLSANATGANSSLKIGVAGDADIANLLAYDPAGSQKLSQTQAALDAELKINGIAISRPDNNVAGAIEGVTLKLSKVISDATVTVAQDNTRIRSALEGLVKAYNDVNRSISGATAYKAVLQGDSTINGVQNRLRSALGEIIRDTGGSISTLSQLGVSFQKDGTLAFDNTRLQSAIDGDHAGVVAAVNAFGARLSAFADSTLASDGVVQARTDGINRSITDIAKRRDAFNDRMEVVEKRYRAQFSALDALLGSMTQTSNYLQQQLANLPNINNS